MVAVLCRASVNSRLRLLHLLLEDVQPFVH